MATVSSCSADVPHPCLRLPQRRPQLAGLANYSVPNHSVISPCTELKGKYAAAACFETGRPFTRKLLPVLILHSICPSFPDSRLVKVTWILQGRSIWLTTHGTSNSVNGPRRSRSCETNATEAAEIDRLARPPRSGSLPQHHDRFLTSCIHESKRKRPKEATGMSSNYFRFFF